MGSTLSQVPAFTFNVMSHWQALVTGGVVTALVGAYQGLTTKQVKPKIYFYVFIIVAFVCSCFLSWHDEHNNTETVIAEKSHLVGLYSSCASDLATLHAALNGKDELATSLQRTLTNLQAPQLQQQATINSCVLNLSKMNPVLNTKIVVLSLPVGSGYRQNKKITFSEILITINRSGDPKGILRCDNAFVPIEAPQIHTTMKNFTKSGFPASPISDREYEIKVFNTGGDWGPNNPIYFETESDIGDPGSCVFTPL